MSSVPLPFDLSLGLEDTHVLVTGGAGLIGQHVIAAFLAAGCRVTCADLAGAFPLQHLANSEKFLFLGRVDITKDIDTAFQRAEAKFGTVQTCIALASLDLSVLEQSESLADMKPETWQRVFDVNINGTFMTCQRWLKGLRSHAQSHSPSRTEAMGNVGLVIMGSESGRFGVRTQAAYAAGKSAVQYGLMYSLAQDAPRIWKGARVNAVAPGAVDTDRFKEESERYGAEWRWRECEATTSLARAIPPEDVARTIVFLASEQWSGSVHGQLVPIDAGKTGTLTWTRDELQR